MAKNTWIVLGATILVVGLAVGVGTAISERGWIAGTPDGSNEELENSNNSISQTAVTDFIEKMRAGTVARVGQPIEGFEPFMFMQAFPGLKASDFANVDALIGLYRYEGGEVKYDLNGEPELHSAARAISDEGMLTLLANVSNRLKIDLTGAGTVDQVIAALEKAPGDDPTNGASAGQMVTVSGKVVCLPKKGPGPHTMECAFGLKAADGKHYGLKNADIWDTEVQVTVTGVLQQPEPNMSYDIVGVIDVKEWKKI